MPTKPFDNIATAIAFSPNLEANMHESVRITRMLGHKLFFIHVGEGTEAEKENLHTILAQLATDDIEVKLIWEKGDIVEALLRSCADYAIDLLVAGAQPREGLLRYYMGSIARQLVRKTNCSILLMTHPNKLQSRCGKIVVNGIAHPKTPQTLAVAVKVANCLHAGELIVVEEVVPDKAMENVADDKQLQRANEMRKNKVNREQDRLNGLVSPFETTEELRIDTKILFGKRGYTIGHFTQTACADLLVMNSPDTKLGFLDRVFTHGLEYVLSELPSDLLIVHSHEK